MSSRKWYGNQDHEYLVSAITNRKEVEREFGVVAYSTMGFSDRVGVLVVRTEVRKVGEALSKAPLCSLQGEWPNATPQGWAPFLMSHYSRLYRLVEDSLATDMEMPAAATK